MSSEKPTIVMVENAASWQREQGGPGITRVELGSPSDVPLKWRAGRVELGTTSAKS